MGAMGGVRKYAFLFVAEKRGFVKRGLLSLLHAGRLPALKGSPWRSRPRGKRKAFMVYFGDRCPGALVPEAKRIGGTSEGSRRGKEG